MAHRCLPIVENGFGFANRATAYGQHGGKAAALRRKRRMTDRVDASVHAVQATRSETCANRAFAYAGVTQLACRHHSVLLFGDSSDDKVRCGDFPIYDIGKSPQAETLPLRGLFPWLGVP